MIREGRRRLKAIEQSEGNGRTKDQRGLDSDDPMAGLFNMAEVG